MLKYLIFSIPNNLAVVKVRHLRAAKFKNGRDLGPVNEEERGSYQNWAAY